MTRKEALARLAELAKSGDTEEDHMKADGVLCRLLETLGYDDVVAAWIDIDKWYA